MALLIDIRNPSWMKDEELRDTLAPRLPGVPIYCGAPVGILPDVIMIAVVRLFPGAIGCLPKLELVQKLGAGVDGILSDPDLPSGVRVTRLKPDAPAEEIAEYCLAYVLRDQRNMSKHAAAAANGHWQPVAPRRSRRTTVAVLGLGHIGARTAQCFAGLGFRVLGWSRRPKALAAVDCRSGAEALPQLLAESDYVVSVLPSTPETRDLFDTALMANMRDSGVLINVGRGDLIVEADLMAALDAAQLGGSVLDVFREEPLPADHPFWNHPRITVTPHVSGWHLDGGLEDVAENYRRLAAGQTLLHEVDKSAGY